MKLLAVDFDGTLADTDEAIRRASLEVLGKPLGLKELRALDKEVKARVYDLSFEKYFELVKPNLAVVNFAKKLVDEGYFLVVLTARPCKFRRKIENFLKKLGLEGKVICRSSTESDEVFKLKYLKSLSFEELVLIEDKEDNISFIRNSLRDKKATYFLVISGELMRL